MNRSHLQSLVLVFIVLLAYLLALGCSDSAPTRSEADPSSPHKSEPMCVSEPTATVSTAEAIDSPLLPANKNQATKQGVESPWQFELTDGSMMCPFDESQTAALVLVFVATDCPIANAYQPLLKQLSAEYSDKGVQFILVYPSRDETVSLIQKHAAEFKIDLPLVLDRDLSIANRVGAEVTPEAFLIERESSQAVYRGKIDNQYADYGKKRRSANQHFLADAIDSLLANRPIAIPKTKPLGCFISYD